MNQPLLLDAYEAQLGRTRVDQADKILKSLEKYLRGGRRDAEIFVSSGAVVVRLHDKNASVMSFDAEKTDFRDALAHALQQAELADSE